MDATCGRFDMEWRRASGIRQPMEAVQIGLKAIYCNELSWASDKLKIMDPALSWQKKYAKGQSECREWRRIQKESIWEAQKLGIKGTILSEQSSSLFFNHKGPGGILNTPSALLAGYYEVHSTIRRCWDFWTSKCTDLSTTSLEGFFGMRTLFYVMGFCFY